MSLDQVAARLARRSEFGGVWQGVVATSAADESDRIKVVVPDIDPKYQFGLCRWQHRGGVTYPARGDKCLVLFDNRREPWVVAWWPFDD